MEEESLKSFTRLTHSTFFAVIVYIYQVLTCRRARLKIWYRKVCRFDSDRPHHSSVNVIGREAVGFFDWAGR